MRPFEDQLRRLDTIPAVAVEWPRRLSPRSAWTWNGFRPHPTSAAGPGCAIVHQGLTRYNATFWVGANAMLRKSALDDIMVEENYKGFTVRRYVRDRTVVEDTESSIDLRLAGWRMHNVLERLSYSATPPDFGSLCVQRERWANGGLMILPKLMQLACRSGARRRDRIVRNTASMKKRAFPPLPVRSSSTRPSWKNGATTRCRTTSETPESPVSKPEMTKNTLLS